MHPSKKPCQEKLFLDAGALSGTAGLGTFFSTFAGIAACALVTGTAFASLHTTVGAGFILAT